jgi:uncharacterized phage protein gp47/JayE
MATLNTQTFTQMVSNFAAAVQGACAQLTNFTVGSVLLAIDEATAGVAMWLQSLILQVLTITRAATSSGSDLDTWMSDYNFTRLPATYATGQVTLGRFSPSFQATIPIGTTVQTGDGLQQFTVIADTTQSAYNASLNAYVIPANTNSAIVTVQAVNSGTQGNVAANTITQLTQVVQYVDTVTNAAALTNAVNAESDSAFRTRFQAYINSLSKATKTAIGNAVLAVQQGLSYVLVENQSYGGITQPGYFYVVLDDGTGHPSSTLLSTVANAVDAVRPFTSTFAVFAPVVQTANVAMTITTASGYSHATVVSAVQAALQSYINALPIGGTLYYTRLEQVAYDASPGVVDVYGVTLNSGTADLVATNQQIVKYGTVAVA